jgi:hypothetical protein
MRAGARSAEKIVTRGQAVRPCRGASRRHDLHPLFRLCSEGYLEILNCQIMNCASRVNHAAPDDRPAPGLQQGMLPEGVRPPPRSPRRQNTRRGETFRGGSFAPVGTFTVRSAVIEELVSKWTRIGCWVRVAGAELPKPQLLGLRKLSPSHPKHNDFCGST